jgi:hypothetical protein
VTTCNRLLAGIIRHEEVVVLCHALSMSEFEDFFRPGPSYSAEDKTANNTEAQTANFRTLAPHHPTS